MNSESRVINSLKNMINGLLSQFISLVLSFVVRTVFIIYLDKVYLGVNGLFTNILTILSLAELGFGTAMIYSMYKPLAKKDYTKIQAIMKLYSKVYIWIGIIVAILGISIIPFMDYIIKDKPNIDNLTLIYLMFLANSVFSYFFAYKRSILTADQKDYICSQYRYVFNFIKSILQIIILVLTSNFILYLLIQIISTLLENILVSMKVDKMYPYLKEKNQNKLSKSELNRIIEDVKALILTKVGHVMLNGTDNIIISAIVGVTWVGLLSNYTLITGALTMVLSQITSSVTGSVGNFIAQESKDKQYNLFNTVDFITFWLYSFCGICLIILFNPFIKIWIGKDYMLSEFSVTILAINFIISGIMSSLWTFRSTMGLFTQGKYRPIVAAVLNIIVSIFLGKYIGIAGVLLGTTISRLFVNLWYDPYIIYKYGFEKNVKKYYLTYFYRIINVSIICIVLFLIRNLVLSISINLSNFILMAFICLFLINIYFIIIYKNLEEFKYIKNLSKNLKNSITYKLNKKIN